ncbi:TIGR02444 family protein [Hyphobacterium sp.]|uniref:TIGR02444 family protein n=1 Tax=Hyphobacterium sp. TaxID=2004662 RepID=UPI00374A1564
MSQAFWDWSLQVYEQPGVAAACLDLQDRHGLNVNICLWCLWLATEGRNAALHIEAAMDALENWSGEVTSALRETRRKLKDRPRAETLYKSVLACELDAEHVEQDILFELAASAPESGTEARMTAAQALAEYARLKGLHIDFTSLLKAVLSPVKKV